MTPYELRNRIRGGLPVFGTLIVSPSPKWPEVVADCDLDFIFIDTEHIAIDRSQLSWMCHAYNGIGLPTLVNAAGDQHHPHCCAGSWLEA